MKEKEMLPYVAEKAEVSFAEIHDGRPAGSKSYMWVHLTGELSPGAKIVVYEYQKTRHSSTPKSIIKTSRGF